MRPRRTVEPPSRPVPQARINDYIRASQVRLIDDDGAQLGIKPTKEAMQYAFDKGLDLVEVASQADPPVARVMDYGKYRYEQEQKAKLARKHQTQINVKEIKLRPKIGVHDYNTKKGHVERFTGVMIEHYGGAFPVWLAPVQIRIIPVGEDHRGAAHDLKGKLEGLRVEIDERDETVGKRIRDAEVEKIPYVIVYGDKESDESLAVRKRGGEQSTLSLEGLRAEISRVATL